MPNVLCSFSSMLSIAFFIAVLRAVMLNAILPSAMESNSAMDFYPQLKVICTFISLS